MRGLRQLEHGERMTLTGDSKALQKGTRGENAGSGAIDKRGLRPALRSPRACKLERCLEDEAQRIKRMERIANKKRGKNYVY